MIEQTKSVAICFGSTTARKLRDLLRAAGHAAATYGMASGTGVFSSWVYTSAISVDLGRIIKDNKIKCKGHYPTNASSEAYIVGDTIVSAGDIGDMRDFRGELDDRLGEAVKMHRAKCLVFCYDATAAKMWLDILRSAGYPTAHSSLHFENLYTSADPACLDGLIERNDDRNQFTHYRRIRAERYINGDKVVNGDGLSDLIELGGELEDLLSESKSSAAESVVACDCAPDSDEIICALRKAGYVAARGTSRLIGIRRAEVFKYHVYTNATVAEVNKACADVDDYFAARIHREIYEPGDVIHIVGKKAMPWREIEDLKEFGDELGDRLSEAQSKYLPVRTMILLPHELVVHKKCPRPGGMVAYLRQEDHLAVISSHLDMTNNFFYQVFTTADMADMGRLIARYPQLKSLRNDGGNDSPAFDCIRASSGYFTDGMDLKTADDIAELEQLGNELDDRLSESSVKYQPVISVVAVSYDDMVHGECPTPAEIAAQLRGAGYPAVTSSNLHLDSSFRVAVYTVGSVAELKRLDPSIFGKAEILPMTRGYFTDGNRLITASELHELEQLGNELNDKLSESGQVFNLLA